MNAFTIEYTDDIPRMTSVPGCRIAVWAPYGHQDDDVAGTPAPLLVTACAGAFGRALSSSQKDPAPASRFAVEASRNRSP
jgi:hypothetical protein